MLVYRTFSATKSRKKYDKNTECDNNETTSTTDANTLSCVVYVRILLKNIVISYLFEDLTDVLQSLLQRIPPFISSHISREMLSLKRMQYTINIRIRIKRVRL